MLASELVRIIEKKIELDGDLPIKLPSPKEQLLDVAGVYTWPNEREEPKEFMLLDPDWAEVLT